MQKTIYWDMGTQMKINKIQKKLKGQVSQSAIIKKAIHMTEFDKMVEELNKELGTK